MTTTTRHGRRACYLHGCRQPECVAANTRYMAHYHLDHQRGHLRRVNAHPAAEHARALTAAGWSQQQIADTARCTRRVITDLLHGRFPTLRRTTSARILAIPAGPPPVGRNVDATGTIRRLRALVAIGHPYARIAPVVGMHEGAVGRIARGEYTQVRTITAQAIADAYQQLQWKPGTSNRARAFAQRNGWHGPLAWDNDTIDDPAAQPDTDDPGQQRCDRDELAAYRREEIAHLAQFGTPASEIATRLRMSPKTVRQYLAELRAGTRRDRQAVAA